MQERCRATTWLLRAAGTTAPSLWVEAAAPTVAWTGGASGLHLRSTWPTVSEFVRAAPLGLFLGSVKEYSLWTTHDLDNIARAMGTFH
jgi:hypothetical protein